MTSWAVNATVTFQHGRLERKDAKRRRTVRHAGGWVGRDDDSMPPQIPGINTSVNFERRVYLHFSHGFNLWRQDRLSHPEITIMRLINDFTDREDWQIEVDDFSACREWREEAFTKHFPESSNLWEWCVFELRKKASEYKSRRSVFVLDSASRICKSDRLVRGDFLEKLKLDTLLLELSPWMLPFVFELSPIRIDGRPITLDNFLDSMTIGDLCPRSNWGSDRLNNGDPEYYSGKSQWLATDVKFSEKNGSVSIISPINNLHPIKHKAVYSAVEHLVSDLIDDWNEILLYKSLARGVSRIMPRLYRCAACSAGTCALCSCSVGFREYSAWANDRESNAAPDDWHERRWNPVMALDGQYISSRKIYDKVSLRDGFKDRGLQIYVEISTIKLDSDGSVSTDSIQHLSWNLNGNRNERIVATTLICLRRENIASVSGGISFRTETRRNIWEDRLNECRDSNQEVVAGSSSAPPISGAAASGSPQPEDRERTPVFQELGTVRLPEGRMVTYPNTLQHKFESPTLEEPYKPGSLQFMHIHLVDPHYVVCSTRFVPPQSLDWWKEAIDYEKICLENRIPRELSHYIIEYMLVPERWLNRKKKRVRGLQNYWQTFPLSFNKGGDVSQPRQPSEAHQPPIRYESGLRRRQDALQRHERVMRAVNGPKRHSPPRAFTVWMQSRLRDPKPFDGDESDSEDLASILAPEANDADADWIGNDAANSVQDVEDDSIADFDSPFTVAISSGSEGSTDGEEGTSSADEYGHGNGGSNSDGDDGNDGDGERGSHEAHSGGDPAAAAVAQDEAAGEGSDEEQDYVDALYGLTSAELAEIEAMTHPNQEEEPLQEEEPFQEAELESLYDDAMSQADEMELYDID